MLKVPEKDIGSADRLYVYAIEASESYKSFFGGVFNKRNVPISSIFVNHTHPYADYKVWRPAVLSGSTEATICSCHTLSAGKSVSNMVRTEMVYDDLPEEVEEEMSVSLEGIVN